MEVLQCDGCDFRAESYDDLKTHIQDVHTAFLQPTDVGDGEGDGSPCQSRSDSLNSPSQTEGEEEDEQNESPQTETSKGTPSTVLCMDK